MFTRKGAFISKKIFLPPVALFPLFTNSSSNQCGAHKISYKYLFLVPEASESVSTRATSVATWSICRDGHKKKQIASVNGYNIEAMTLQEKLSLMTRGKKEKRCLQLYSLSIHMSNYNATHSDDGFLADGEINKDKDETDDEDVAPDLSRQNL